MKEAELEKTIRSLPVHIEPERDLWPGIRSRLESTRRPGREQAVVSWRIPALAAAVIAALAVGLLVKRDAGMTPAPAEQGRVTVLEAALRGSLQSTEREYQGALRELLALDYSGARLPGSDTDSMRASWDVLRQTENQLQLALRKYPADAFLSEKLLELKSRQLRFVMDVAMLEQNDWRNI